MAVVRSGKEGRRHERPDEPSGRPSVTVLLILLMLVFAAAGGFLGDFLELAGIVILILVVLGAGTGGFLYLSVRRMLSRR